MDANEKKTTIDDLPELPFDQMLSYLSLGDLTKARAVSRRWYCMIDNFKVKSLCFSERPSGVIEGKSRVVVGVFAQNFISSNRFLSFFNTFRRSVLSNLKRLRLCELNLNEVNGSAFAETLNSLAQLEELCLFNFNVNSDYSEAGIEFELNLSMLTSIHIDRVKGIKKLTLDAPRLLMAKLAFDSYEDLTKSRLIMVHDESIERLLTSNLKYTAVKNLKNLQYLNFGSNNQIEPSLLSGLDQLKEIHFMNPTHVEKLFKQKQDFGLVNLSLYLNGVLLNGLDDPPLDYFSLYFEEKSLYYLAKNPSRMADEMPFHVAFYYPFIEHVGRVPSEVMSRLTRVHIIAVDQPVRKVQLFLSLLKNCDKIDELMFFSGEPQELFDRLFDHCAVQNLVMQAAPSDLGFLFTLKHLIRFNANFSIDLELIGHLFKKLPFLSHFCFKYNGQVCSIEIPDNLRSDQKRFRVYIGPGFEREDLPNLESAMQCFLMYNAPQENAN